MSDRLIIQLLLASVLISAFWFFIALNNNFVTNIPTSGGTLVEGIVGTPRFVNPVLAITRADKDVVALVYSGLMKHTEDGTLAPDIAKEITVSEDGRVYHITLRDDVYFHNGIQLTVKDIAYTIALIQNPELKSPLRGNWERVLIEELGDFEMNIVLEEAYAPFIENLTVGILPREIWDELPTEQLPFSQNNTEPIGTGPYKVADVLRSKTGLISGYKLTAVDHYAVTPNIDTIVFNFYQNEEALIKALNDKMIASTAGLSNTALENVNTDVYTIIEQALPRTFTIYFNQNKSIPLRDKAVREALNTAIDKQDLINQLLDGYGVPTNSPIPPGFGPAILDELSDTEENIDHLTKAKSILSSSGWSQNGDGKWVKEINDSEVVLSIALTTANTPLFDEVATYVAEQWSKLGVEVSISQFEQADLVQAIIRPRSFEALLFGADIGRAVDLYPFWHSSQKDDPGLNIAQYTNIDADALLERIRTTKDAEAEADDIVELISLLNASTPAIFLFTPTFGYVIDKDVHVAPLVKMDNQSNRFTNIEKWHIKSNKVWPIFSNN